MQSNIKKVFFGAARGLVSNGINRYILDGNLAVCSLDSEKFGEEIHFTVYSKDNFFQKEKANKSAYRRVEFYFPLGDLDKLIATLEEFKEKVKNGDSKDND